MSDLIDVNVCLSRWPFRRLPLDETPALVEQLRKNGVTQAWAGTFDALLHNDIASANERLVVESRKHGGGILLPFGTVNPMFPDWEEELRRCNEVWKMHGLRLYPAFHGYALGDDVCRQLCRRAAHCGLLIQIVVQMEDARTQHRLLRLPPVELGSLANLTSQIPQAKIVLLNAVRNVDVKVCKLVAQQPNVYIDTGMIEGVGALAGLLQHVPAERVLFGSHAPLFYIESNLLKFKESEMTANSANAIRFANARALLANPRSSG